MPWLELESSLRWLDRLGVNALIRGLYPRPLVLGYPRLAESPEDAEGFPLDLFKRQLVMLHTSGYRFASMDDFAEALARPLPQRLVVLAFVGGLRNTVRVAYPALQVLGARGILYVTPERVPAEPLPEEWGADAPASWSELRALDPGLLQVGNHGRSSIDCAAVAGDLEIEREIWRMGLDIEQQLGYPVHHFACPPGGEGLVDPVRLAAFGYSSVLVPGEGFAATGRDPFALRRLTPEREHFRFRAQISGTLTWVERQLAPRPAAPARPAPEPEAPRARAARAGAERGSAAEEARNARANAGEARRRRRGQSRG